MRFIIVFILIIILLPLVSSLNYGGGIYGENIYGGNITSASEYCGDGICNNGETCSSCSGDCGGCSGGGNEGGGGITAHNITSECSSDANCKPNQYCFNSTCFDSECFNDSFCNTNKGEICWNHRCVKLFDMEIIDFESPVKLGEFFNFTYFIKAVAEINGDVEIDFWIEKDGNKVASGKDTIYMSSFEEKTKTKKLFLPSDISSGSYMFYIQVTYETYIAEAHRNIEISVNKGVAKIKLLPELNSIVGYVVAALIGLSVFLLCFVFYLERKKIKRWYLYEQRWAKKHVISIIVLILLIILGFLIYYFKWYETITEFIIKMEKQNLLIWGGVIMGAIILIILGIALHKKHKKRKLGHSKKSIDYIGRSINYSR